MLNKTMEEVTKHNSNHDSFKKNPGVGALLKFMQDNPLIHHLPFAILIFWLPLSSFSTPPLDPLGYLGWCFKFAVKVLSS